MINQTTLKLGGKERTLLFSSLGILEYIQDEAKRDPFEWLEELRKQAGLKDDGKVSDLMGAVKGIRVIIYGALNCHLDSIDEERIPFDKVNKWCTVLNEVQYAEIFSGFVSAMYNKTETGEAEAPENGA